MFPNARVWLQRDELIQAIDPAPSQRLYYTRRTISQSDMVARGAHCAFAQPCCPKLS